MARPTSLVMVVFLLLVISMSPPMHDGDGSTGFAFESVIDTTYSIPDIAPAYGDLIPLDDVIANAEGAVFTVTLNFRYELLDTSDSEVCDGAWVELHRLTLVNYQTVQVGHTDDAGTIVFHNVSDGVYLVRIEADDGRWVHVQDGDRAIASNYYWNTQQFSVNGDRQLDYRISDQDRGAWAIYRDLRDGGKWLWGQTGWQRSQVTVIWPEGEWPHSHGDEIHIPSDEYLTNAIWQRDISLHEYGHCVHYELRGGSFPEGEGPDPHYIDSESSPGFAFTEGWAQFFERAVDGDPERSDGSSLESTVFADGPFGDGDAGDMDGSRVEGAVANLLWDIYDGADPADHPDGNALGDNVDRQFVTLWDIMYQHMPEDINDIKRDWPDRTVDVQAIFLNARISMELGLPSNPTDFHASHQVGTGSLDSTVDLLLQGAEDDGSGVLGYSILIDGMADSLPDRVMDIIEDEFTTPSLSPGTYYVHIRTVDQDGNWAADVFTIGPFIISEGAAPVDEPLFPEGDSTQALIGLVIVLVAVGLILLLVVPQEKKRRPAVPPTNQAYSSTNCPYCGRPDLGGTYCSYCGGRLR